MMQWIDATERKPPNLADVLVWVQYPYKGGGIARKGHFNMFEDRWHIYGNQPDTCHITHWMKITPP